mmetsp:Transcript_108152/g.220839  ORF Transcript_108152/g.220839 Transcript_108152/m.220839 type:complete len:212 (+) Transcript_108152:565-1200(+)
MHSFPMLFHFPKTNARKPNQKTIADPPSQSLLLPQPMNTHTHTPHNISASQKTKHVLPLIGIDAAVFVPVFVLPGPFARSRAARSPGTIELHEIRQVMRKLGQNPTDKELNEMISTVDSDGDKEIDFEEFLILMKSRTETDPKDPDKELRDAFAVFDTDGSGSIDKKELKRLMKKLGQALTEAEVDAMMEEVDSNGDGEISYEEFKSMMNT